MITPAEILGLLGQYIRLAPRPDMGSDNVEAYCPFHKGGQEQTPSFYIYVGPPTRSSRPGDCFCHTCQRGWSLTSILKKFGVRGRIVDDLRYEARQRQKDAVKRSYLKELDFECMVLPEELLAVYSFMPTSLVNKGFSKTLLREMEIGFDREHRRVTFPIRDHHGDLVGISGRATQPGDEPRYKIYRKELEDVIPNYRLDKKKVLWGLHTFYVTAMHCTLSEPVIVCEGFKAALWVRQCGHPFSVATMGTSLSKQQEALLTRVTNNVVLFLDNNDAGKEGTNRLLKTQLKGVGVRVANYGERPSCQPDDLTKEELDVALTSARTRMDILWQTVKHPVL